MNQAAEQLLQDLADMPADEHEEGLDNIFGDSTPGNQPPPHWRADLDARPQHNHLQGNGGLQPLWCALYLSHSFMAAPVKFG